MRSSEGQWVTTNPKRGKGQHILLGPGGEIKAGLGGKFTGKNIKTAFKNAGSMKKAKASKKQSSSSSEKSSEKKESQKQNSEALSAENKKKFDSAKKGESAADSAAPKDPTPEEKGAVDEYAGEAFVEINGALRSGNMPSGVNEQVVKDIDSLLDKSRTESDITTTRFVRADFAENLEVGASFTDQGFTSTTFGGAEGDTRSLITSTLVKDSTAEFEILLPKGSKAANISDLVYEQLKDEKEILIARNTKYTVAGIDRSGEYPKYFLIAETS